MLVANIARGSVFGDIIRLEIHFLNTLKLGSAEISAMCRRTLIMNSLALPFVASGLLDMTAH